MNEERFNDNFKVLLALEKLGIRTEDVKTEGGAFKYTTKTAFYYSVPESSTMEVEDAEINARIKTPDGLKLLAKEIIADAIIDACKAEYPDEEDFVEDIKKNASTYFKFYAKVRIGDIWTNEKGDARVKELCEDIQRTAQYREV